MAHVLLFPSVLGVRQGVTDLADALTGAGHDVTTIDPYDGQTFEDYPSGMARTQEIDSATSQFFINLKDNDFLDHGTRDFGYAVFAKVTDGMEIIDRIAQVATGNNGMHRDVPLEPVVILSAKRV